MIAFMFVIAIQLRLEGSQYFYFVKQRPTYSAQLLKLKAALPLT